MNIINTMIEQAINTQKNAYTPYSNFKVGACIATQNNSFFTGCNVENAAFGSTICAEAVAIGQMIAAGYQEIKEILIIGDHKQLCAPCGNCRQLIQEFANTDTKVHLCINNTLSKTITLKELLPLAFDKNFL